MLKFNTVSINGKRVCLILLALLTLLEPSISLSKPLSYYNDPKLIIAEASKRGAGTVVSELYSNPTEWIFLLRQIATGSDAWLKVAVALHPGSDAGASQMLALSIGEALENAPENVFKIVLGEFHLNLICGAPDLDDPRYGSYELAMEAIKKRQTRISAVTDSKLRAICNECIQLLEKAKDDIAMFYRKDKSSDVYR
jgi:hypothetical protein